MSETIILIIAAFVTSMISAVIGMGGGITLLGIMALLIPEGYMVVALHGVIQLVSNMTRTTIFRAHIYRPIIRQFTPGIILGLILSTVIVMGLIQAFNVESASRINIDFLKPLIGIYILWFYTCVTKIKKCQKKHFFGWEDSVGW